MQALLAWVRNLDIRKVAAFFAGLTVIEALIAHGDVRLAGFPPAAVDVIKTWCGNFVIINQALVVGHLTTAAKWPAPSSAVAKALALFAVLLASLVLLGSPAYAQTTKTTAASISTAISNFVTQLQAKDAAFIANVIAGLNEADKDAGAVVNGAVKDPVSHACYQAQIQYLGALPSAQPVQTPAPGNLIVLFQYKRDLVSLLLSGQLIPSYLKVGCAALLGNEAAILVATAGLIGIAPAAVAPLSAFALQNGAAAAVAFPTLTTLLKP